MKRVLVIIALFSDIGRHERCSSLSSEADRHDFYANFLACMLIEDGTADVASEFNLSPDALRAGIDTYSTEQTFSSAEIESFQWRAAMPTSCSQYVDAAPRYAHYVVDEALAIFNQAAGLNLVWTDISTRATGQACGSFLSLATPSLEDEAFAVMEAMVQASSATRCWASNPAFRSWKT